METNIKDMKEGLHLLTKDLYDAILNQEQGSEHRVKESDIDTWVYLLADRKFINYAACEADCKRGFWLEREVFDEPSRTETYRDTDALYECCLVLEELMTANYPIPIFFEHHGSLSEEGIYKLTRDLFLEFEAEGLEESDVGEYTWYDGSNYPVTASTVSNWLQDSSLEEDAVAHIKIELLDRELSYLNR